MELTKSRFTVFFEGPFWVGVYERVSDGNLTVCKVTFGAEPKDYEVYEFLLAHWQSLQFSPPAEAEAKRETKINPKRLQRKIKKQVGEQGIGTRSQQALKRQQEEKKTERIGKSREQREAERERQYAIRQKKKREKHRGR